MSAVDILSHPSLVKLEAPVIKQESNSVPVVNNFVQQKVSKRPSLFSPPSDSEGNSDKFLNLGATSLAPGFKDTTSSSSRSHSSKPIKTESHTQVTPRSIKTELQVPPRLIKTESQVAPEPFKRPEQEPTPIKIEPKSEMAPGAVPQAAVPETKEESDKNEREKRHKEKKKKKEKSRDKDREREETTNGAESSSSSSKKHKHKHKEKSKHRDSERESGSSKSEAYAPHHGIKLKIKPLPPVNQAPPPLAPLKIRLSQINGESSSSDPSHRKRPRDEADTGIGPASKMSRVLGTSVESESKFLHVVGGSSNPANHLAQKPPKKVSEVFNM